MVLWQRNRKPWLHAVALSITPKDVAGAYRAFYLGRWARAKRLRQLVWLALAVLAIGIVLLPFELAYLHGQTGHSAERTTLGYWLANPIRLILTLGCGSVGAVAYGAVAMRVKITRQVRRVRRAAQPYDAIVRWNDDAMSLEIEKDAAEFALADSRGWEDDDCYLAVLPPFPGIVPLPLPILGERATHLRERLETLAVPRRLISWVAPSEGERISGA